VTEPFLLQALAITPAPPVLEAALAHHGALREQLGPIVTGRCAPTFLDSNDGRPSVDDEARARLDRIRAAADPDGRFAVLD
jgi:hypothetical protein